MMPGTLRVSALLLVTACSVPPGRGGSVDEDQVARRAGEIVMERVRERRTAAAPAGRLDRGAAEGSAVEGWPDDDYERVQIPAEDAPARGAEHPLVTIVTFSDFQCPFCGRVVPSLERLLESFPQQVRLVFRHNPLPFHRDAPLAHQATIEAWRQQGDAGFWRMHDRLFTEQHALSRADLERHAADLGLDLSRFGAALDDGRHEAAIEADQGIARRVDARGTPAFFINGRRLMGAQPYLAFETMVDEEIQLAQEALDHGVPRDLLYAAAMRHAVESPERPPAPSPPPNRGGPDPATVYRVPVTNEPSRGPADALVTIVVFSDFECPFCSRVRPTLDQIFDHYGNDVRVVFMNNPLPFHGHAQMAAEAALEAYRQRGAQGFWAMHDLLFDNQRQLGRQDIEAYGRSLRLNMGRMKRALDGHTHAATIRAQQALAQQVGSRGTPGFFVNGRHLRGAQPFEAFRRLIDEELVKARRLVDAGTPRARVYEETIRNGATSAQDGSP